MVENVSKHTAPSCFLSCDWGTSSFRLRLVSTDTGLVVNQISSQAGIKACYNAWQSSGDESHRAGYFLSVLDENIQQLQKQCDRKLDALPVIISGMASSTIGIKELPYRNIPIDLRHPELNIEMIAREEGSNPVYLVSGICSSEDVMRGEETELLGLQVRQTTVDGLYVLAGTHSKHIRIEQQTLTSFKTYLTGELFELLSTQSILSNSVSDGDSHNPGPAFIKGVLAAQGENLLHMLFQIRAKDLLTASSSTDHYEYLSGLLIGTELRDLSQHPPQKILLWAVENLQIYYRKALEVLDLSYVQLSLKADEDATALGHLKLIQQIYN